MRDTLATEATVPVAPLSQFDYHHALTDTPGIALVLFTAPDCGSCRHWRRVFRQLASSAPWLHLFEVDAQRDTALAREFEIFHLPSLFLYREGHYHCALQAQATQEAVLTAIDRALALPPEEAP